MRELVVLLGVGLVASHARAEALTPERLGVIFNQDDRASTAVAAYYTASRGIPAANLVGLSVPNRATINREELKRLRDAMQARLPSAVQSLLLVWSRPFAVECMSITTAFAAEYKPDFCEPGCGATLANPLFDSAGWLPADTTGWLPAMLLPSDDQVLARSVIDRGVRADGTRPPGTLYLIRTHDPARNVRAAGYADLAALWSRHFQVRELEAPITQPLTNALAYFTGAKVVDELAQISFRPGAAADHLTSTGGVLEHGRQMSALEWLKQGATASYGTVSEPCNVKAKFPNPAVFMRHYLAGDALIEAYWKSVAMPGQGLFLGEPLARPFVRQP